FIFRRKVQPDLKQFEWVRAFRIQQRKHFRMNDSLAGGQPLHIPWTESRSGAERIRMIDVTASHDGDGFESAMRMLWEPWHDGSVIHPPAVFTFEILSDTSSR